MSIDPTDPRPPYRQVADRLRDTIVAGELAPGQALPSVRALAQQYGVTNVTATRAVDVLRSEGRRHPTRTRHVRALAEARDPRRRVPDREL